MTWDLKINESQFKVSTQLRQRIPGNQSLHSHCTCEFKIKNRVVFFGGVGDENVLKLESGGGCTTL